MDLSCDGTGQASRGFDHRFPALSLGSIEAPLTVGPAELGHPRQGGDPGLLHPPIFKAPNVAYVDVAEAGHFVMLDQPEAFEAAVEAFLK